MQHAASFFRTPLLAAVALPFISLALSGHHGLIDPSPEEGSPTYLAIQQVHDAFSLDGFGTQAADEASDTEEARANILQANQIVAPTFYF